MSNNKTILVTGGLGFIGSHVAIELMGQGYEVILVDNLSNSSILILDLIEAITHKKPIFYNIDIRDDENLLNIFLEHDIVSVMHFAGLKSVTQSIKYSSEYFDNNVNGSQCLLKCMTKNNVGKIIFSSTASIYGTPESLPIPESHPLNPSNPYAKTKLEVENILHQAVNGGDLDSAIILRYFNPIGAHSSGLIGEMTKDIPNNLMPYLLMVAANDKDHLNIFGNDYDTHDGTGIRDYIHILDLAEGHIAALNYLDKFSGIDIFNLGTGRGTSVLELIKTFEITNQIKIKYKFLEKRLGDVAISYTNPSYAKLKLDWYAKRDVSLMCKDAWRWQSYLNQVNNI